MIRCKVNETLIFPNYRMTLHFLAKIIPESTCMHCRKAVVRFATIKVITSSLWEENSVALIRIVIEKQRAMSKLSSDIGSRRQPMEALHQASCSNFEGTKSSAPSVSMAVFFPAFARPLAGEAFSAHSSDSSLADCRLSRALAAGFFCTFAVPFFWTLAFLAGLAPSSMISPAALFLVPLIATCFTC